jgi:uncharacterized SAM-binding protein YcdF (DUF218 family)
MADLGMWKPVLTALALPPVPMLVLMLWGAWRLNRRRTGGVAMLLLGAVLSWFSACDVTAITLQDHVLHVPAPLSTEQRQALAAKVPAGGTARRNEAQRNPPRVAVIVLGGGMEPLAPEYGVANLSSQSTGRLLYGVWLSRQLGAPLGFSGGVGWAQKGQADGSSEAEVAARIAAQVHGVALRWVESASADTRGNADATVGMLAEQGVQEVVLVTSAFHMPRAQRDFEQAAAHWAQTRAGAVALHITPAATGYWRHEQRALLEWLPSGNGFLHVTAAVRECLGLLSRV